MGSYRFVKPKTKKEIPSAWRGIGCIFMLLLPVVSYFSAIVLLNEVTVVRTFFARATPNLFGTMRIPPIFYHVSALNFLWIWLQSTPNLLIYLFVGALILIFLSGFIGMIYAFMYRAVAPSKYGPTDVPPQKRSKNKKYSR